MIPILKGYTRVHPAAGKPRPRLHGAACAHAARGHRHDGAPFASRLPGGETIFPHKGRFVRLS